jgi:hypothetical protein
MGFSWALKWGVKIAQGGGKGNGCGGSGRRGAEKVKEYWWEQRFLLGLGTSASAGRILLPVSGQGAIIPGDSVKSSKDRRKVFPHPPSGILGNCMPCKVIDLLDYSVGKRQNSC